MNHLLKALLEIPTGSGDCGLMIDFINAYMDQLKFTRKSDDLGNIYVTKGDAQSYPCVVAHMDTVHKIEKGGITAVEINGMVTGINPLTMEQTGIGGDDKCGIYSAIMCLIALPACKAAFFVDEEVGCLGSSDADMSFFNNCRYVLQADRRGCGDWVTDISGKLGSKRFQTDVKPILKEHGYKPCHGMMSDVMALRDNQVGVSCANMSAGYYNPHSDREYISLEALDNVTDMMIKICLSLTEVYPFTPEPKPKWQDFVGGYHGVDDSFSFRKARTVTKYPKTASEAMLRLDEIKGQKEGFPDYEGRERFGDDDLQYCMMCYDQQPASMMAETGFDEYVCSACKRSLTEERLSGK